MFLVRHGQSEFNVVYSATRVDPGIEDPGLTALGRRQAGAAAETLAGLGIVRLVSSPYRRALQTASIIGDRLGLPIDVEPLVRERRHFVCDVGSPASTLRAEWPDVAFGSLPERWWPEDSESEAELAARCARFGDTLAAAEDRSGGGSGGGWGGTAYVSHWAFIRGLTGLAVTNGSVVALSPDLQGTVVHVPDV